EIVGATDYTAFQENVGMSCIDLAFAGPYGVYHSQYDDYFWVERFGDPGFRFNVTLARLFGLMAWGWATGPSRRCAPPTTRVRDRATSTGSRRGTPRGRSASMRRAPRRGRGLRPPRSSRRRSTGGAPPAPRFRPRPHGESTTSSCRSSAR